MAIMGFDPARYREFVGWTDRILRGGDRVPIRPALDAMDEYLGDLIDARLAEPGEDAVSVMLKSEIEGKPLSPDRVHAMCNLLFLAGLDTITSAMTHMMYLLARDPPVQQWLRANPQKIPNALEELLRRLAFLNMPRRLTLPHMLNGVGFEAGDTIVCSLAAASNDERTTPDPVQVDFARKGAPSLAFNTGPHVCAGAPLARIELRAFLKRWFERMPDVALAPGFSPGVRGGTIMALDSLQLVWKRP
jgi:cytochrome P450